MTYSVKLSLMSTYRIRKILIASQKRFILDQDFMTESQLDLDKMLNNLYIERSSLQNQINQLETLVRMHQVLAEQQSLYGVHEIENKIFNIFGLKIKSA